MKKNKNEKNEQITQVDKDLEQAIKKKKRKKIIIISIIVAIVAILISLIFIYNYFYGNKGYIRGDVTITSSSKLYLNSDPDDIEDVGEGALFILYIEGIKRDNFLDEYEVTEISVNGNKIDLENVTYRHLNKALSIRFHNENYDLEKGNSIIIEIKQKNNDYTLTRRLYHKTEIL